MRTNQSIRKIVVNRFAYRSGVLLAVISVFLFACAGQVTQVTLVPLSVPNQPAATATTTTGQAPVPSTGNTSQQAVFEAIDALQKAGPYRTQTKITSGEKTIESSGEFIPPDRFHVHANGQEIIAIGSKGYTNVNGKWEPSTTDLSAFISGVQAGLTQEVKKGISDFQYVGVGSVNDELCRVYQFREVSGSGSSQIVSQVKMWINADGLPLRQVIDGEFNGVKSHTVQDITYDPSITVEEPAQ